MRRDTMEFWYEFASTYSYPAAMRAQKVAAAQGVKLIWRPFLLGPIFKSLGWTTSPFNLQPAKGAYMWRDMERTCRALSLPFARPVQFPQNGIAAARIALALTAEPQRAEFTKAVYLAQFAAGQDIGDGAVLSDILTAQGKDAAAVIAGSQATAIKDALRRQTENAQQFGIFGAPTWRTADGEIFWGNDRLEDAVHWAKDHSMHSS